MNILIIQENGRHDANRRFRECYSLQRAFASHGHTAVVWGLGHSNFKQEPKYNNFDIILNLENYDSGWVPILSKCNSFKILWAIDEHCRGTEYYDNMFNKGSYNLMLHSTLNYVKDETNHMWFPNCFDDTLILPKNVEKRADVGFCGNILNRGDVLEILQNNFDMKLDIFIIGDAMVDAINSYRVAFNKNIDCDVNYRSFETIGCKIPLVTNSNYQYDQLGFVDGVNCMLYSNEQDMIDKIGSLLNDDCLRNSIAENGYELSKRHTYNVRVKALLNDISDMI